MDGFDPRLGVIVLGATNRPEILDPALLRPGRFDRRVVVSPPDRAGREAILRVHTRGVPLAAEVNLGSLASTTPGMVGADLENLVNEAALLAARRKHEKVNREDLTDALERIVLGAERKVMISEEDRRRTAYHEAGHAIVGMLTPGADPVRKVSIIPRGQALGVTFSAPDADRFNFEEQHLLAQIKVALGGRVAEELVFRRHHHRRRVRHPASDPDRPPHGRAMGDEPRHRTDRGDPGGRDGTVPPGRRRDLGVDPAARRRGGQAGSSNRPTPRSGRCCASIARTSIRSSPACSSTKRSTRPTPTRPPPFPATRWPSPSRT